MGFDTIEINLVSVFIRFFCSMATWAMRLHYSLVSEVGLTHQFRVSVKKSQFSLCYIVTAMKVDAPKHDESFSFAEKLGWF